MHLEIHVKDINPWTYCRQRLQHPIVAGLGGWEKLRSAFQKQLGIDNFAVWGQHKNHTILKRSTLVEKRLQLGPCVLLRYWKFECARSDMPHAKTLQHITIERDQRPPKITTWLQQRRCSKIDGSIHKYFTTEIQREGKEKQRINKERKRKERNSIKRATKSGSIVIRTRIKINMYTCNRIYTRAPNVIFAIADCNCRHLF